MTLPMCLRKHLSTSRNFLISLLLICILCYGSFPNTSAVVRYNSNGLVDKRSGVNGASDQTSGQVRKYRLTDLGVINSQGGQMISHAAGINNAGQVAGYSYSGTSIHAARFTNGVVLDLGTIPGGSKSTGVAINDLGHVVGDSEYSQNGGSIRHAVLFSNGTATDLGTLPSWGNYSRGNGINDGGVVVGHSGTSLSTSNTRAFIWDATNGMRDLGTIGGAYSKAHSINNSGVVTGTSQSGVAFGGNHAFIWDAAGGMRDIGTIAGTYSSGAYINDNGHIAGSSSISSDNREHAFLYDGTTMRDLGSLGGNDFLSDRSTAYGINIHDHVVGGTYRPYTGGSLYGIPFIYRDGQMFDLTTLVDASGADYQLGFATGINDAGQIAIDQSIKISTNQIHAVLLTPIATAFDFDGDGKADVSVYRPSEGTWYLQQSTLGFSAERWGNSTDKLMPADYDGDGRTDLAVFRRSANSTWYILNSATNTVRAVLWGASNLEQAILFDTPVPADYDGDGKTDLAVWRLTDDLGEPARFLILQSSNNETRVQQWGNISDRPVPADFDGDNRTDLAVYRGGTWYISQSADNSLRVVQFGSSQDKTVAADYDGDGKSDLAVYRGGTWYLLQSSQGFAAFQFGLIDDIPTPADYDGDGKTDVALYRDGVWYMLRSSDDGFAYQYFGLSSDIPVESVYLP